MHDVIIVGGGPVGSQVARKLAVAGYKVMVLERKQNVGEKVCCTGIIGQECAKSFTVDDDVILRKVSGASLFSPSRNSIRLWREETQACILDRIAFDIAMAKRAQKKGAEYILDSVVRDITIEKDRVVIEASHQGKGVNFEARAAVIAAGFNSRLTEKLGLGNVGDFVIGAQSEVETTGVDEVEVYFGNEIAPGFFGWLVPTSPRTARAGLLSRRSPELYLKKLLTSLLAQGKIVSAEAKLSRGGDSPKATGQN